ncbi:MAG: restriction endonuclease subunit S [Spirochaetales bacterium]|nr:restriction endonuclease subunit S [Spirochaetales bacterium]MDY5916315.1 restriction endonuclease subunit S [Treponema sp.]
MSNIPKLRFPEFNGEWEEKKLSDIASFSKGKGYTKNDLVNDGSPIILYGRMYTKYETVISDIDTFVNLQEGSIISKGGEIIVPASGETAEEISRASVVKNKGIILGGDLNIISLQKDKYNPEFFALTISSGTSQKRLSKLAQGKSVVHLHNEDLSGLQIKVPTLAEQQKIADFLSNVDSIITAETKILKTLQKKKKALMQKLFTRQLRFKSDDGTDFPAWEEKKLGEISSSPKYGLNASGIDYDGEHKYLRITDIDEVTHTFSPEEITTPSEFSDDYLLEENDIVFARTGASTGKTYLYNPNDGDLYFAGFLIKFHIKDANARFVFYQTCTHEYEKWVHVMSTRSGQPGINSEEYSTLKIKLPCIEEQQKIADCLSIMDSLIQTQQKVVTTWQQRKKALLQQMFI